MAVIYEAELKPTKRELLESLLSRRAWSGSGPIIRLGAYRFDDPAGLVGVEAHLVQQAGQVLHVPLTYRPEPLPGAEEALVAELEHSVLGRRWVYDGTVDPVARDCFEKALRGELEQAELEIWEGDRLLRVDPNHVLITREGAVPQGPAELTLIREPAAHEGDAGCALRAAWPGGGGVVATLRPR